MEFENAQAVTNDDQRLADASRLVIRPAHQDIQPEANPDRERASTNLPIGNIAIDTEVTGLATHPSPEQDMVMARRLAELSRDSLSTQTQHVALLGTIIFFLLIVLLAMMVMSHAFI